MHDGKVRSNTLKYAMAFLEFFFRVFQLAVFLCNFYGMIEINNVNNGVCNVTCSLRSSKDIFLEYMENTIR